MSANPLDLSPRIRELFEAALNIEPTERAAWLDSRCPDAMNRLAVERLLTADHVHANRVVDHPFSDLLDHIGETHPERPPAGTRVGAFTLHEQLGEGGSSIVFRATREQDGVTQVVALKLLRRNLFTEDERRRFRDERRALSQLQHPGIARLIEGGLTEAGTPYIALDLVEGESIVDHARNRQLDLPQRLRLFVDVCRAVEAAHRALIVHRDLKPSNVMVTSAGEVKLLDFGIAKLLDNGGDSDATQTHHAAMTPAYAAPEQFARGQITTATDVYSLGVLLGELITGHRHEHGDSRTPSAQVTDSAAAQAQITNARAMRKRLRGDLDNIVLKATAEEPENRYASAGALADDIARHLKREPVVAHPPSHRYRAFKFISRHRGGVISTALFLAAILSALGIAVWQGDVARHEARRATAVRDFIEGLFDPLLHGISKDQQPSLVELLARGATQIESSAQLEPSERVDLLSTFSRLHESIGELTRARELANEAVRLAESALPANDVQAMRALSARGYSAVRMEDYAAASQDLREAYQRMRAGNVHGAALIEVLEALGAVETIEGNAEATLQLSRQVLEETIRTRGADDARVGTAYNDIASALEGLERYDEATAAYEKTYRFMLAHQGSASSETALALGGWASTEFRAGHWTVANRVFDRALAAFARADAPPQLTYIYIAIKGCFLSGLRVDRQMMSERCDLADALTARGFGSDSALYGDALEMRATGLLEGGDLVGARSLLDRARILYGGDPANRMRNGRADSEIAAIQLLEGHPENARALLPNAIEQLRTRPYLIPPLVAEARLLLACSQSPGVECVAGLETRVVEHRNAVAERDNPELLWVDTILARLQLQRGETTATRRRLSTAVAKASAELDPSHPRRIESQLWLALADARAGDCERAIARTHALFAMISSSGMANHPFFVASREALRKETTCGAELGAAVVAR